MFTDDLLDTWLGDDGYCWPAGGINNATGLRNVECVGPGDKYAASIYWAVMTITSIGFGDVSATPLNTSEMLVATCLMLFGSMVWGQIISTFCLVLATTDAVGTEFRQRMDDLNDFLYRHGLPQKLKHRLREYYHEAKHLRLASTQQQLLVEMSPALRSELVLKLQGDRLRRIWFVGDAIESQFVVEMALALRSLIFAPGEAAGHEGHEGYLYIISKGRARYFGMLLSVGKGWGHDVILENERLRRRGLALAMTYLEVQTLGRKKLFEVINEFPAVKVHMRKCAARLALCRKVIFDANLIKAKQRQASEIKAQECIPAVDAAVLVVDARVATDTISAPGTFRPQPEGEHRPNLELLATADQRLQREVESQGAQLTTLVREVASMKAGLSTIESLLHELTQQRREATLPEVRAEEVRTEVKRDGRKGSSQGASPPCLEDTRTEDLRHPRKEWVARQGVARR